MPLMTSHDLEVSNGRYERVGQDSESLGKLFTRPRRAFSPLVQGNKFQMSGTQLIITAGIFAFLFMTLMLCATGLLLHYLT